MQEIQENVLDLARFRSDKLESRLSQASQPKTSFVEFSSKELSSHIDNIKQSIQRINNLMEELKSISNKSSK